MLNITVTETNASRYFRCADRALSLLHAGYTFKPFVTDPTAFFVDSPTGAKYTVHTHIGTKFCPSCDCPDYVKNGDFCKHILCAAEIVRTNEAEMWETICAEVETRAACEVG